MSSLQPDSPYDKIMRRCPSCDVPLIAWQTEDTKMVEVVHYSDPVMSKQFSLDDIEAMKVRDWIWWMHDTAPDDVHNDDSPEVAGGPVHTYRFTGEKSPTEKVQDDA